MSGISITKATYGAGSSSVDVTAVVASKVKDGVLSFTVSPTALNVDDPAPGQLKQLDVTYSINGGSSNTQSAKDNEAVLIDAPPAREASGLQIVKAEYGYVGNYTDVTDAVQSMVKDGQINTTVGYKEVGIPDPNPNKVKELVVTYTINGASSSTTIKDGKTFKLSAPPTDARSGKTPAQHVMSAAGIVFSNAAKFVGVFLHTLSFFSAYKYGEQFIHPYIFAGLALFIPFFSFWALPILTFWVRIFYSQDFITA